MSAQVFTGGQFGTDQQLYTDGWFGEDVSGGAAPTKMFFVQVTQDQFHVVVRSEKITQEGGDSFHVNLR